MCYTSLLFIKLFSKFFFKSIYKIFWDYLIGSYEPLEKFLLTISEIDIVILEPLGIILETGTVILVTIWKVI